MEGQDKGGGRAPHGPHSHSQKKDIQRGHILTKFGGGSGPSSQEEERLRIEEDILRPSLEEEISRPSGPGQVQEEKGGTRVDHPTRKKGDLGFSARGINQEKEELQGILFIFS